MLKNFVKEYPIASILIVILIGCICAVLVEQSRKTGVFQFETESERCFVANKVGYAPSISCVKK